MSLFLSVVAFLMSVAAVTVGAVALRRINGQNEEFLKAYVQEIRNDLLQKDQQITTLRRELAAVRSNRSVSREALRTLEIEAARKRQMVMDQAVDEQSDRFLPSQKSSKKRYIA